MDWLERGKEQSGDGDHMQPQGKEATSSEGSEMMDNKGTKNRELSAADRLWRLRVMVAGKGSMHPG